jgi:hypothetical protein
MPTVRTIDVKDAAEVTRSLATMPDPGSAADAASLPVSQSTEDKAVSAAIKTAVETVATAVGSAVPVSAAALPLPTGAATAAKQPTLGTAGTASADVLSVQGVASMTALKVDGSAVTQPASIAGTVNVKTTTKTVAVEITRPSDTTAYAANDVVSVTGGTPSVQNFADMFSANGASGYVVKARLSTDQAANVASFRLHIYHTAPTAIADNSAYTQLYADESKYVGYIDFQTMGTDASAAGVAAYSQWAGQLEADAAAADVDLYCVLVTKTIFTPASAQKFTITLTVDRN